jgi:hypothetical protein
VVYQWCTTVRPQWCTSSAPSGYPLRVDTDLDGRIAGLDPADPVLRARGDAALGRIVGRHGELPGIEHYRRVYADLKRRYGIEWPGDERVREMYPVAP